MDEDQSDRIDVENISETAVLSVAQTTEQSVITTPTISNLPLSLKTPVESMDVTPGGTQEWVNIVEDKYRPKVGMEFSTLDKGIEFYMVYAVACGFVSRRHTETHFRDGVVSTKIMVCNRQGVPRSRNKENLEVTSKENSTREIKIRRFSCKAKIKLIYKSGKYVIDQFYEAHNHQLTLVKHLEFNKLVRNLTLYHKKTIVNNMKINVGSTKTFRLCKEQSEGYENVGASLTDFKNFKRDIKCFIGDNDGQMFINNLNSLSETRKGFYFAYELDSGKNIVRLFWADPEARRYYSIFGDTVSYDPTYGTNVYKMVFTPFTGMDNHKKSVCFAAALLKKEDEKSFQWVFEKFMDCMDGKEPNYIITDQDPGIKNAVPLVFKTATHKLCMWHITNKIPEKVGSVKCRTTTFLSDIQSLIWNEDLEPDEFEEGWKDVLKEHKLLEHEWLQSMFQIRDQWIPSYFRDVPMGSILRTTQRSESANSFFKIFENQYGTLVEFWMRFVSAMEQQRHKQKQLELESVDSLPKKIGHLYIEEHARKVYTHEIFYDFQQEIKCSAISCSPIGFRTEGDIQITLVKDFGRQGKQYEIQYKADNHEASCSCKLYFRRGLLCRHIIWLYSGKRVNEIPERYVAERWSKNALRKPIFDMDGNLLESYDKTDVKKREMCKVWNEIYQTVGIVAAKETTDMEHLIKLLQEFRENIEPNKQPLTKNQEMEMLLGFKVPTEVNIFPPNQCKNKGSGSGGKRLVSIRNEAIDNAKRSKRMCRNCKQMVYHDSRNCTLPFVNKKPTQDQLKSD